MLLSSPFLRRLEALRFPSLLRLSPRELMLLLQRRVQLLCPGGAEAAEGAATVLLREEGWTAAAVKKWLLQNPKAFKSNLPIDEAIDAAAAADGAAAEAAASAATPEAAALEPRASAAAVRTADAAAKVAAEAHRTAAAACEEEAAAAGEEAAAAARAAALARLEQQSSRVQEAQKQLQEQLRQLVLQHPRLLSVDPEGSLKAKLLYVQNCMYTRLQEVLEWPQALTYGLYTRIVPRHLALVNEFLIRTHAARRPHSIDEGEEAKQELEEAINRGNSPLSSMLVLPLLHPQRGWRGLEPYQPLWCPPLPPLRLILRSTDSAFCQAFRIPYRRFLEAKHDAQQALNSLKSRALFRQLHIPSSYLGSHAKRGAS
ncbi:hypothetical protein cyc_04299 [Cyclospora cayetanensis]|uniref:Uncharacterized protein n=1 Tax=Cyclospora cayetanensis TaxID=88456 RepID=A0A1D3CT56_9EIME|nr:hypothetical protein cyc_04299 [Cyclospora cayetanensis]